MSPHPIMPANLDAERALLGLILLEPRHLREAERSLDAEDFLLDSHRKIFRAMSAVVRNGQELDTITLIEALQANGGPGSVGGVAYIASLTDGLPRRSSGSSFIQQIREKAGLRRLLRGLDGLQRTASAPGATLEACHGAASLLVSQLQGEGLHQLARASADEFLESHFPPRQMVMSPILPQQGLAMLYSRRGVGKTYLALGIAHAVARGGTFLRWSAARPRKVLFVDGELPAPVLQQRLKAIISGLPAGEPALPGPEYMSIVTPDLQKSPMPDLSTPQGQAMVESALQGGDLLVLDNLSCLCRSGKENEGESWLPVQDWALRLRQQGLSVLFVHHAGKGGQQRGTSRREDLLDTVIALRQPEDYCPTEGLRAQIRFEKARSFFGDDARPFEVRMEIKDGAALWTSEFVAEESDQLGQRANALFAEGKSVRQVAKELGISKSRAGRLRELWGGDDHDETESGTEALPFDAE